jgi:hypothetical protein
MLLFSCLNNKLTKEAKNRDSHILLKILMLEIEMQWQSIYNNL